MEMMLEIIEDRLNKNSLEKALVGLMFSNCQAARPGRGVSEYGQAGRHSSACAGMFLERGRPIILEEGEVATVPITD